ncbi:MAG TPA: response regulator transcription factor, partial [Anaerolineales bacterium]
MNTIRLMLVDDHKIVRTGLRSFLEDQPGLEVIAEAGSGERAIELAQEEQPDVIIMDITMEGMDGLEATRRLKEVHPEGHVLALTVHQDKQYFFEMLASGASGYVTKQAAAEELVTAIHSVAEGHVYLQPALARWLLEDYQRLSKQIPLDERMLPT